MFCPSCGSECVLKIKRNRNEEIWRCKKCKKTYSFIDGYMYIEIR